MEDRLPKLDVQGKIPENIPVLLQIFYDKYDPEQISTELTLLGSEQEQVGSFQASLPGDEYGTLEIISEVDLHSKTRIKGLHGFSVQNNKARLDIVEYECGFSDEKIEVTKDGLILIRNVAASFDPILLNSDKTFSKSV